MPAPDAYAADAAVTPPRRHIIRPCLSRADFCFCHAAVLSYLRFDHHPLICAMATPPAFQERYALC